MHSSLLFFFISFWCSHSIGIVHRYYLLSTKCSNIAWASISRWRRRWLYWMRLHWKNWIPTLLCIWINTCTLFVYKASLGKTCHCTIDKKCVFECILNRSHCLRKKNTKFIYKLFIKTVFVRFGFVLLIKNLSNEYILTLLKNVNFESRFWIPFCVSLCSALVVCACATFFSLPIQFIESFLFSLLENKKLCSVIDRIWTYLKKERKDRNKLSLVVKTDRVVLYIYISDIHA